MSKIAHYIVSAVAFGDVGVTLQVDHDVLTPELATRINQSREGAEERLLEQDRDVVKAVIRQFGEGAINYFISVGGAQFSGGAAHAHKTWPVIGYLGYGWPPLPELGILVDVADVVPVVFYADVTVVQK